MSVDFAGLKLKNPYIAASGCWGYGWEGEQYFPGLPWGAVVSKTITLKKREGNPPPRIFEVDNSIINRIGLQNCGLDNYIKNELPKIKLLPYPVISSIFGYYHSDWETMVTALTEEKAAALELNFSCPNVEEKKMINDIDGSHTLVKRIKDITPLPIIAKINAMTSPVELCSRLKEAGIDGIVCSNTFPSSFILGGKVFSGGLSGPAIKPEVLKTIKKIKKNVDVDIAACGGIQSPKDIEDYRIAGAKAFILGSILLLRPTIVKELSGKEI